MKQSYEKLDGNFQKIGNTLSNGTLKLLIVSRKSIRSNTGKGRQPLYLLNKSISDPQKQYISSLYPMGNNSFKFDYNGLYYLLSCDDSNSKATIKLL